MLLDFIYQITFKCEKIVHQIGELFDSLYAHFYIERLVFVAVVDELFEFEDFLLVFLVGEHAVHVFEYDVFVTVDDRVF